MQSLPKNDPSFQSSNFIPIPPAPPAPPLAPDDYYLLGPTSQTPSNNLHSPQAQALSKKQEKKKNIQKELDDKIYELPVDPPKLELGDGLVKALGAEADDVLDEKFVNKKKQEDEALENFKEEYGFEEIKDAFNEVSVPNQLDFSMVDKMKTLPMLLIFCH